MNDGTERLTTRFALSGKLPRSGQLAREAPAAAEGPPAAWELAEQVIDHGVYILVNVNSIAEGRKTRDAVLAALLRRALITAEGVRVCLYHSLEESAVVLLRTLLEAELNMRLVTQDKTEGMATRLAAYHYLKAKRHVTDVLEHPVVQRGDEDFKDFMKGAGRRNKEFFATPVFDDVRESLLAGQHWHGFKSIEAAFGAVGDGTDYLHLYSSFSPFVHVANLDYDFVDIVEDKPHMKPLPQRNPRIVQNSLQGMVLIVLRILELYLEDKGVASTYAKPFIVAFEDGESEEISPVQALQTYAIGIWGASEGWTFEPGPGDGTIEAE